MTYTQFEFCCGVYEIGDFKDLKEYREPCTSPCFEKDFYHTHNAFSQNELFLQDLKRVCAEVKSFICMATTAQNQPHAAEALAIVGFEKLHSFKNPNSGNQVTLWIRYPKAKRTRKAK